MAGYRGKGRGCGPGQGAGDGSPSPEKPTRSAVRQAVRTDLKAGRRRLYALIQTIDAIMVMADEATLIERGQRVIEAVRRLPDAT
ncbi:hypothetical protein [Acidiphilium acidophilum]|uniref:Uncharacterized protein n=1 Tax=Acidiphilium acidophilum TaxID=76588 RepID=A0AAW9DPL5_ACIAO|nr:hypothetical protein [Acidiphilium acidophilum]MDX5930499.1 hypothetical protein [Acidiphilium acidophilum]MEE3502609.1 hypothetical protein [Acidiphilium acidophilum]